jgi:Tol biopolymer transport system component
MPPIRVVGFNQLTNDGQAKSGPMATDGTRIYFNEKLPGQVRSLAQVSVDGGDTTRMSIPLPRPRLLDLSRDRTAILLGNQEANGSQSLWLEPVAGGSPRRVGRVLANAAALGNQQTIVYGSGDDIYVTDKEDAATRKLLTAPGAPYAFNLSPDGKTLRFSHHKRGSESVSIMETPVGRGHLGELLSGCCGKWTDDQHFFIFEKKQGGRTDLWAQEENDAIPEGKRVPIHLTAGPLDFEAPISGKNSKEIFAIGSLNRDEIVRYDSRSRQFVSYLSGISAEGLSFSRDGKWVAYTSYPDGALWRCKIDGSERLQLTFPPMRALLPRWSPLGHDIAFMANSPGRPWNIYILSSEGGTPREILPDSPDKMDVNWSPDGNSLIFGSFDAPQLPISIVDLKTGRVSTLPGSIGLFSPRWSPDGRYICAITAARPFKLMLFDFRNRKWVELFGSEMAYPSWSHDGRYIYFEQVHNLGHDGSASINRMRISDHKLDTIVDLKEAGRLITGSFAEWTGLAPDDSPLLSRDISTHEIYSLRLGTQ